MSSPSSGPSQHQIYIKHSISGHTPGLLDPLQPQRLLRIPNSTLSFAAFDPRTASADKDIPDLRKLSINEELYRPKRVVIETAPNGESFWRFVPRARREDGVADEGSWPRVVDLCGELVEFSEDQWDIYKLDPAYDCLVQLPPKLSKIARVAIPDRQPPPLSTPTAKRKMSPEVPRSPVRSRHNKPRKKTDLHKRSSWSSSGSSDEEGTKDDSEEEYEVEGMVVDDPPLQRAKSAGLGERTKRLRAEIQNNRKMRREKIARTSERIKQKRRDDENMFTIPEDEAFYSSPLRGKTMPPPSTTKRKVSTLFESLRSQNNPDFTRPVVDDDDDDPDIAAYKRTRTVSPRTSQRKASERRLARDRLKKEEMAKRVNGWTQRRHEAFMQEVYAEFVPSPTKSTQDEGEAHTNGAIGEEDVYYPLFEFPPSDPHPEGNDGHGQHDDVPPAQHESHNEPAEELDEEALREASIAESRRKLAELEADRPLWEEAAKRRQMSEQAEESARRAKAEERRRTAEMQAEAERRTKAEQEEQKARETAEKLERAREETARRDRERRQRHQRWSTGFWTISRALERYRDVSDIFDATKFSPGFPLHFDDVPWPVLHQPTRFTVEDVDWTSVEKFFDAMKPHMRAQDFKTFVQTSHRRFHPDRWRSRGLLKSIHDEAERGYLEVAANTVAQALTPLWTELKGR